ncbi:MAG: glycosyltransferase [Clostridia bacterium]|nr:glycosyltransferase [Clostridia bacterium]
MTPLLTVVVPVYNVKDYLETCVDSLLCQTLSDIEILLVDDGSTDGSGALCDTLAERDPRIRVLHKPNGGLSSARNAGVCAATADLVGLVDSDDYVDDDMFELLYRNLVKENADVSACTIYSCYGDKINRFGDGSYHVMSGIEMIGYSMDGEKAIISACPKLYKKDLLLKTPFVEGKLYEDALLFGELFVNVSRVVVEEQPKYYYVHHEGTITTATYKSSKKDYIYAFEHNLSLVREHCPQFEQVTFYRVLRAYYELLDTVILADNDDARADKPLFKRFLRKHLVALWRCPYIRLVRKCSITLALTCEPLYKKVLLRKG